MCVCVCVRVCVRVCVCVCEYACTLFFILFANKFMSYHNYVIIMTKVTSSYIMCSWKYFEEENL